MLTDSSEWRFIPGKLNPVDHATQSAQDIEETLPASWLDGPLFLREPEEQWPVSIMACRLGVVTKPSL